MSSLEFQTLGAIVIAFIVFTILWCFAYFLYSLVHRDCMHRFSNWSDPAKCEITQTHLQQSRTCEKCNQVERRVL